MSDRDRSSTTLLLWTTWLVGPASFGLAFVGYVLLPEFFYGYSDPGPDLLLALVMVTTHSVAGACTIALVLKRGPHRRTPEFWLIILYWAGIAGWIVPGVFVAATKTMIDPTLPRMCTGVSAAVVVIMPVVGLARWLSGRGRTQAVGPG